MGALLDTGPPTSVAMVEPGDDPLVREIVAWPGWSRLVRTLPTDAYLTVLPLVGTLAGHEAWYASVTDQSGSGAVDLWLVRLDGELRVLTGGDLATSLDEPHYERRFTGLYACKPDGTTTCTNLGPELAAAALADPGGPVSGVGRLVAVLLAVDADTVTVRTELGGQKLQRPQWDFRGRAPKVHELHLKGDRVVGDVIASGRGGGDSLYAVDADVASNGQFSVTVEYLAGLNVYRE